MCCYFLTNDTYNTAIVADHSDDLQMKYQFIADWTWQRKVTPVCKWRKVSARFYKIIRINRSTTFVSRNSFIGFMKNIIIPHTCKMIILQNSKSLFRISYKSDSNASRICILFAIFHSFGLINVDEIRIALKVWMYNLFEYKGANFHHHFFPKGNRLFPSKFLWIVFTRFVLNTDFHAHNKACHKARDRSKKSWN